MSVDVEALERIGRDLLEAIGEDPDREGLRETPRRWARWWTEFIDYDDPNREASFQAVTTDQMIIVRGLRVWSLCEHHLLPFSCDVSIGYIAGAHVLGLSKFARIARYYAHRLQIQERLVHQIADEVETHARTSDVAVLATGEHLCLTMRGARTPHQMISSVMRGAFLDQASVRSEFLSLSETTS